MTRRKLPPVTGIPADRPRCPMCNRPLGVITRDEHKPTGTFGTRITARHFARWRAYNDLFDRLSCALTFATLAHRAGYRPESAVQGARVVVVYVEGGCISGVEADDPTLRVIIHDHDSIKEGDAAPEVPAGLTEVY